MPNVKRISRNNGMAGQLAYVATVEYPNEPDSVVTFVGSSYGGPVVMVTPNGTQTFVTDPERFGRLSPRWVRLFFGDCANMIGHHSDDLVTVHRGQDKPLTVCGRHAQEL